MVIRLLPGSNEHCLLYRYHSTSVDGNCNQTLRQKAEEQLLLMHATFGEGLYNIDRDTSAYPRLPVSDERSDTPSDPRNEQAGVEWIRLPRNRRTVAGLDDRFRYFGMHHDGEDITGLCRHQRRRDRARRTRVRPRRHPEAPGVAPIRGA